MTNYEERLSIPIEGPQVMNLYSNVGIRIARGYQRVVIGGRGPYVEFTEENLSGEDGSWSLIIPEDQKWRLTSKTAYYIEYRCRGTANAKIYKQVRRVDYADYIPGLFYISPFELKDDYRFLITPIK